MASRSLDMPKGTSPLKGALVLIVEDHAVDRKLLSFVLAAEGCVLQTAATVEEATRALERSRPALVLLDINLPGGNGLELARQLSTSPDGPAPVLVAMTAYGSMYSSRDARSAGCDGYLEKPLDTRTVAATLAGILVASRRRSN